MSFVGATLLFLGGGLSFVVGVLSFVGGGFIWGWCTSFVGGGLMFMGGDCLVGGGCRSNVRGCLFVVLSWCCVVRVIAVRRGWETDGYLNNLDGDDALSPSGRRGTDATSSPPSTRGCCCCPCCCLCVPWALWAVDHSYWRWWPLARCLGQWERLGSMVVVGREGLLVVCSLLMTTNRVSGFADARFGCS